MVAIQRYFVTGALEQSMADGTKEGLGVPFGLLVCINAYTSRRKGSVLRRGGSVTEPISGTLGRPLGMAIYKSDTQGAYLPITTKYLANFAGTAWRKYDGGYWTSVTVASGNAFSTTKQMSYEQLGPVIALAAGKPAKWTDGGNIEPMGYAAPSVAITFTTSGGSLSPTVGYTWMYTYYNSATGKESDWSPISANSGPQSAKRFTLTLPTAIPATTANRLRIYRTIDNGTVFYHVADVTIGTATYIDNTDDLSLGVDSAPQYRRGLPPTESYIVSKHMSRFFWVDADNAYQLVPSRPYVGNVNDVEYYDYLERLTCQHEITGLHEISNALLIFGVRQISKLTGVDVTTFQLEGYKKGIGTQFHSSISSNGESIVFLGEGGFKALTNGQLRHISKPIDEVLRPLLSDTYNNHFYVASAWNPVLEQFIFSISASSGLGTPWEIGDSGIPGDWEMSATGELEYWTILGLPEEWINTYWEDSLTSLPEPWELLISGDPEDWVLPGLSPGSANSRVKCWGWNPYVDEWSEYRYPQVPDFNTNQKAITFFSTPYPSSQAADPQQESTFIGIDQGGGSNGIIVDAWRGDRPKDDLTLVVASALTDRIQPGRQDSNYRRFRHLQLEGDFVDITSRLGTVQYLKDVEDPHLKDFASLLLPFIGDTDLKVFIEGKARWVNIYFELGSDTTNNLLCSRFAIRYAQKEMRDGR